MNINKLNLLEFIELYNKSVLCGAQRFIFEGREVLLLNAYEVLKYLNVGEFDSNKLFIYRK